MLNKYIITLKNIVEEDLSQEFMLKKIKQVKKYLIEEIDQNKLISDKHKKVCKTLNYIDHFLILAFVVTECISKSVFASLLGITVRIRTSAIGFKIFTITTGIRKYKSMINKKKTKHDKI